MEHLEKALQYIRDNKTWSDAHEEVALEYIGRLRCSIEQASKRIANEIAKLMGEYGIENGLEDDWWEGELTCDDIFWKL